MVSIYSNEKDLTSRLILHKPEAQEPSKQMLTAFLCASSSGEDLLESSQ